MKQGCENCIHEEVCALCDPMLPICDSYKEDRYGRWVKDNLLPTHCSVCGELPLRHRSGEYERLSPYCPNCGAKMDLEATE